MTLNHKKTTSETAQIPISNIPVRNLFLKNVSFTKPPNSIRLHYHKNIQLIFFDYMITLKHILPLIIAPLIIEATFSVASVIIAEAGLSFLGLGIQPPAASWGSMIRDGTQYMLVAPHMVLGPGFAILSLVLCINLLGDYLRDKMDIRDSK